MRSVPPRGNNRVTPRLPAPLRPSGIVSTFGAPRMRHATLLPLTILLLAAGCTQPAATPAKPAARAGPAVAANPHSEQIRSIAATYTSWTRVSDRANYAPGGCIIPPPVGAQQSAAEPESEHARKLYYLFARTPDAYPFGSSWYNSNGRVADDVSKRLQPVGQTIVKQSFHAIPCTESDAKAALTDQDRNEFRRIPSTFAYDTSAEHGVRYARIGEPTGLFIMLKVDPATPDTDNGWIYATISPAGEVTSSGRVASCMGCHVKASYDRLFGPKNRWEITAPMADPDPNWHNVRE